MYTGAHNLEWLESGKKWPPHGTVAKRVMVADTRNGDQFAQVSPILLAELDKFGESPSVHTGFAADGQFHPPSQPGRRAWP